jgi:hypothetical protein
MLKLEDMIRCRHCDLEIDNSRVSVTITKTNCAQFRQSVQPNRIASFLGANVENYAACEHWKDQSLHPRSREYLFGVANVLLTVPRAVGNLAGNPILETTDEVKGSSSTHRKGFDNNKIDT